MEGLRWGSGRDGRFAVPLVKGSPGGWGSPGVKLGHGRHSKHSSGRSAASQCYLEAAAASHVLCFMPSHPCPWECSILRPPIYPACPLFYYWLGVRVQVLRDIQAIVQQARHEPKPADQPETPAQQEKPQEDGLRGKGYVTSVTWCCCSRPCWGCGTTSSSFVHSKHVSPGLCV